MDIDTRDSDGLKLAMPLRIEYEEMGLDGKSTPDKFSLVAERSSIKINGPIDADTFTLSPQQAKQVYDLQTISDQIKTSKQLADTGSTAHSSRMLYILIANAATICLLVALYVAHRRRKSVC
jgi:hypothetical protein